MAGGFPINPEFGYGIDVGSSLTTGGTAVAGALNTPGAWVQIIASTAIDTQWAHASIFPTQNSSTRVAFDIGVGAAASEVAIVNKLLSTSNTGRNGLGDFEFPFVVPAGSRISARSSNSASTDTSWINLRLFDTAFQGAEAAGGVDAIGFTAASTKGTTLTAGAAGVKGVYAQIIASTARDYAGFFFVMDSSSIATADFGLVDIAVGAGGSEVIFIPNVGICVITATLTIPLSSKIFWRPIPSGSRLAARVAFQNNVSPTINMTIYGIYL